MTPEDDTPKTLFIFNKFYQGNPSLGPTSSWEMIWLSFLQRTSEHNLLIHNPDFFGLESSTDSDAKLQEILTKERVDLIVMIYHNGIGWNREFIGENTLNWIAERKIRTVAIWGDIQIPQQRSLVKRLSPFISLNIMTASHAATSRFPKNIPRFYSWVPLGDLQVSASKCGCEASISFAGSLKGKRGRVLSKLQKSGMELHVAGGEGLGTLSREEYLRVIGHPISVSFAGSKIEPLVNARTFEVLSQGALLMEQWGRETVKFLQPYVDYVPWMSSKDLEKKCRFYIANPEIAEAIARNGKKRFDEFNDEVLWNVFNGTAKIEDSPFLRINYIKGSKLSRREKLVWSVTDFISTRTYFSFIFSVNHWLQHRVARLHNLTKILRARIIRYANKH